MAEPGGAAERTLLVDGRAFAAGALAVLVFQLGLAALLATLQLAPLPVYPMTPVPPLGVPQSLSWAFWGGLWGVVLRRVLRRSSGPGYWLRAVLFSAVVLSAVLLFVVLPLQGGSFAAGWDPRRWAITLILHAAWGLGLGVFLKLLRAHHPVTTPVTTPTA